MGGVSDIGDEPIKLAEAAATHLGGKAADYAKRQLVQAQQEQAGALKVLQRSADSQHGALQPAWCTTASMVHYSQHSALQSAWCTAASMVHYSQHGALQSAWCTAASTIHCSQHEAAHLCARGAGPAREHKGCCYGRCYQV